MYTSKVALVIANTITTNAAITSYCSVSNFSSVRWASRYQIPKTPASNYQQTWSGIETTALGNKFQIQILMFWVVSEPQKMTKLFWGEQYEKHLEEKASSSQGIKKI